MEDTFLVCPFCHSDLDINPDGGQCSLCGILFPFRQGILCFGERNEFYEGKFNCTKDWTLTGNNRLVKILKLLNRYISISTYESRFFQKCLNKFVQTAHPSILDFGCGGGDRNVARIGSVTGVDLSVVSLLQTKIIYNHVYQIDGKHLPFKDESFDLIYTSHVFGHIPVQQKPMIIKEVFRILKPGGYLIGSIECDSNSLIYRRAKKYPELFLKCYIEQWGHYGLELPDINFKRFREGGFLPVIEFADIHKGYLRPATSYENLREYRGKDPILFGLGTLSYLINKARLLTRSIDIFFGLLLPLAYLFTPPSHRDSAKVVYQKP